MFKWLMERLNKPRHTEIKITYQKIKRPKDDEMLIFQYPDNMDIDHIKMASRIVRDCMNSPNKTALFVPKSIEIVSVKNYNWRQHYQYGEGR